MSVEQRTSKPGAFTINLKDSVPFSIRELLAPFGHVVITPTHVDPNALGDAGMLSAARYTGIVRVIDGQRNVLSGPGLIAWLGDEDGKGDILETEVRKTAGTFASWIASLLPSSLTSGTITDPGGTLTHATNYISRRVAMDFVMTHFGADYRVSPNGTFDAGPASALFNVTPTAVALRRSSGRDLNVTGLQVTDLTVQQDSDDYSTRVVLLAEGGFSQLKVGAANLGVATPYKNLLGGTLVMKRIVSAPETPQTNANGFAALQLGRFDQLRQAVSLSTDTYDIGRDVVPGDYIYVYDEIAGLVDTANEVFYRGSVLHPIILRVYAYNWPIQRPMGVYYRDKDGAYTDLSEHVEYEDGATTYEVGAKSRAEDPSDPGSGAVTGAQVSEDSLRRQTSYVAAGQVVVTVPNGTATGSAAVSFPIPFSATPRIVVTARSAKDWLGAALTGSATGFTMHVTHNLGTNVGVDTGITLDWVAVLA